MMNRLSTPVLIIFIGAFIMSVSGVFFLQGHITLFYSIIILAFYFDFFSLITKKNNELQKLVFICQVNSILQLVENNVRLCSIVFQLQKCLNCLLNPLLRTSKKIKVSSFIEYILVLLHFILILQFYQLFYQTLAFIR